MADVLMTPQEVREYLRISYYTLRDLTRTGTLLAVRVSARRLRYRRTDVEAYLARGGVVRPEPVPAPPYTTRAWLERFEQLHETAVIPLEMILTVPEDAFGQIAGDPPQILGQVGGITLLGELQYEVLIRTLDGQMVRLDVFETLRDARIALSDDLWDQVLAHPDLFDRSFVDELYFASTAMNKQDLDDMLGSWEQRRKV